VRLRTATAVLALLLVACDAGYEATVRNDLDEAWPWSSHSTRANWPMRVPGRCLRVVSPQSERSLIRAS